MPEYEVEAKFWNDDPAAVRQFLAAHGAVPHGTQTECDVYFDHPIRKFAETDEALRVRQSAGRVWVTYKGPRIDSTTKTRREIEVEIATGTSAETTHDLLRMLGFEPVDPVTKSRESFRIGWAGLDFVIALDDVSGVGSFVELETKASTAGLDVARQALLELASQLGQLRAERRSYLELAMERLSARTRQDEGWSEL